MLSFNAVPPRVPPGRAALGVRCLWGDGERTRPPLQHTLGRVDFLSSVHLCVGCAGLQEHSLPAGGVPGAAAPLQRAEHRRGGALALLPPLAPPLRLLRPLHGNRRRRGARALRQHRETAQLRLGTCSPPLFALEGRPAPSRPRRFIACSAMCTLQAGLRVDFSQEPQQAITELKLMLGTEVTAVAHDDQDGAASRMASGLSSAAQATGAGLASAAKGGKQLYRSMVGFVK